MVAEQVHQVLQKAVSQLDITPLLSPQNSRLTARELAQIVYQKLTASQFCRRRPLDSERFVALITQSIEASRPIPCILGHGPLKNPNNCPYSHADWAELFAYRQLMKLNNSIRQLYPPGLQVTLYVDDARSEYANHIAPQLTRNYIQSIRLLLAATPLPSLIKGVVSFHELYPRFKHQVYLPESEAAIRQWAAAPTNQEKMERYVSHALKNLPDTEEMPSHERQIMAWDAVIRYLSCHEAEKRCGIWSQSEYLYMRYSPHEGHYQVFTLRKGSVTQPWQGQGCLIQTPSGKFDPSIATRLRRQSHHIVETCPTPLDLPGFSQILILSPEAVPVLA